MSIPHTLACMLVVSVAASTFIPTAQAKASDAMPSCKLARPSAVAFRCGRLHHGQLRNNKLRKGEDYKAAGKPDPLILRIAPYDIDWA